MNNYYLIGLNKKEQKIVKKLTFLYILTILLKFTSHYIL